MVENIQEYWEDGKPKQNEVIPYEKRFRISEEQVGTFLIKAEQRIAKVLPNLQKKEETPKSSFFNMFRKSDSKDPITCYEVTPANLSDVSFSDFWSFGVPTNLRRGLWPFVIPNKL